MSSSGAERLLAAARVIVDELEVRPEISVVNVIRLQDEIRRVAMKKGLPISYTACLICLNELKVGPKAELSEKK